MWPFAKADDQPEPTPRMGRQSPPTMDLTESQMLELCGTSEPKQNPWETSKPLPAVLPSGMAFDSAISPMMNSIYAYAQNGPFSEGLGFLGYPYLAELSQRPEYRRICEIPAEAMTRKWIKLRGPQDKIDKIEKAMVRLKVREAFRRIAELDNFFGRAHLYLDFGKPQLDAVPLVLKPQTIGKDSLKAIKCVEPFWCYPARYNSTDPRAADFYKPTTWYVMGQEVHATRLIPFVGREMPDMLKPAYQFGGLSLSQMAKPYVDNWLRTRTSVGDLIKSFSVMVLKTDIATMIQKAGALMKRIFSFTRGRDNNGLMVVGNDEELTNVSASLASLDKLQAQSQEHICSVAGLPLVEYTGITPAGLNATSEGEIETWHGHIHDDQEHLYREPLTVVLQVIQLSELGAIDETITFEFVHLSEMTDEERATIEQAKAATDKVLHDMGTITNEESRDRVNNDEASPYFQKLTGEAPDDPNDADNDDDEDEPLATAAE